MIVINVNLHSAVSHNIKPMGNMVIYNDGTGTLDTGNYEAVCYDNEGAVVMRVKVKNFPRQEKDFWVLMKEVFKNAKREKGK